MQQLGALDALGRVDLTIYTTRAVGAQLAVVCPGARLIVEPSRWLVHRILWQQLVLANRSRRFDVVYLPGNFALLLSRRRQVLTLQNAHHYGALARQVHRRYFSRSFRVRLWAERALARASVRKADRVIAISESLRRWVEDDFGPLSKLRLVTSARPELPSAPASATTAAEPYALAVAHDYPHKDWDRLVAAFYSDLDLPRLVLVGEPWRASRIARLRQQGIRLGGRSDRVTFFGQVRDRDALNRLYSEAACFVAHSQLEAFPLTPYEAMAHGLPLAVSDIPPHREICGASAVYYDSEDRDALAAAVRTALRRGRTEPAVAGPARTWNDNAAELAAELVAAAGRSG